MKKAIKVALKQIYNFFDSYPKSFSIFATIVSVAGLGLLIAASRGESKRHKEETLAEEGKRKYINEDNESFIKRMNREVYKLNEINSYGTILVFLGFFLQQVYNIIFRM